MTQKTSKFSFRAKIFKVEINPCVDVPKRVSLALGKRGFIPVRGRINSTRIRATLVPLGNNQHRLFINKDMRSRANVGPGDRIKIVLQLDTKPRVVRIPLALKRALLKNKKAKTVFDSFAPSHQKEFADYLNFLKTKEALKRNIQKIVKKLSKKKS